MTLQNRVNPFGNIIATPEYGTCMGNRGILHGNQQNLLRYHQHKHWVICRLKANDKKGDEIRRKPMTPHTYTELFFLDEATALAAGHRPCAECSRPRYNEFVKFWRLGNPGELRRIDEVLHEDRFVPYQTDWRKKKRLHLDWPLDDLPFGTIILLPNDPTPYLVVNESLRPWGFAGYGQARERRIGLKVTLLTPPSTMRTLAAGYRPQIYPEPY